MLELRTFPTRSVLTRRQPEVAACLVHGLTNKETARELKMSPRSSSTNWEATMSVVNWLFRKQFGPAKPPRTKHTCKYCNGSFGLVRPNFPFCKVACKQAYNQAVAKPALSPPAPPAPPPAPTSKSPRSFEALGH